MVEVSDAERRRVAENQLDFGLFCLGVGAIGEAISAFSAVLAVFPRYPRAAAYLEHAQRRNHDAPAASSACAVPGDVGSGSWDENDPSSFQRITGQVTDEIQLRLMEAETRFDRGDIEAAWNLISAIPKEVIEVNAAAGKLCVRIRQAAFGYFQHALPLSAIPQLIVGEGELSSVRLTGQSNLFLAQCDGQQSIERIASRFSLDEFTVYRIVARLLKANLIRLKD